MYRSACRRRHPRRAVRAGSGSDRRPDADRDRARHLRASPTLHDRRSEEHTSELQSLMRISYAVFCLKKKTLNPLLSNYCTSTEVTHQNITMHITITLQ